MKESRMYPKTLLIPAFIIFTVLFVWPSIMGFYYSFTNWNSISDKIEFIGFENFKYILVDEGATYMLYFKNTIVFAVVTSVLEIFFGLLLALLLNSQIASKNILRSIFFIPQAVSPIIIGIMFLTLLSPEGLLNNFLSLLGLDSLAKNWLVDPNYAMPSLIFAELWRYLGVNMVIFLAGLQTIDKSYYEAACIDGASRLQTFTNITIPYIMPAITINLVLNAIHGFRVFDIIFALTNGGPGEITEVLNTIVYREFSNGNKGLSTALSLIVFLITTIVALFVHRATSSKEVEA